jgi:putative ABC transport system ATP-binding protein
MIRINTLTKIYDDKTKALDNINVILDDSFISIIGQSGSGKSTLLNIIGGIDTPTEGEVIVDDLTISNLSSDELADYRNRYIGFIFQSFYLDSSYTVIENVMVPLIIARIDKNKRIEMAENALNKLGILGLKDKLSTEISGGEAQRVAIARAIVNNPKIILADEPTGNLDSKNGEIVMNLLKEISKDRMVIMVTHNNEYTRYSDRVITISDGKVI